MVLTEPRQGVSLCCPAVRWSPDAGAACRSSNRSPGTRADGSFREQIALASERSLSRIVPILPDWAIQILQVVTILTLAPLVNGIIARAEAIVQQRRGPRVLQPYYDIVKLLRKETVLPSTGRAGVPRRAVRQLRRAYATMPLLIPVLTTFPLAARIHGRHSWAAVSSWRWRASRSRSPRSTAAARTPSSGQAGCGRSVRSTSRRSSSSSSFVALTTHTDLPYVLRRHDALLGGSRWSGPAIC